MNIKFEALNKTNGALFNVIMIWEELCVKKMKLYSKMEKAKV
jgi:hypothetical protein